MSFGKKYLLNIANLVAHRFSIVGTLVILCASVSSNASAGWFGGVWKSGSHDIPRIELRLKNNKLVSIVIDGKTIPMKLSFTSGKQGNTLLELSREVGKKNGAEQEIALYLVRGKIKSRFALVGFYTYQEYNSEGVEKAGTFKSIPIILYQE